MFKMYIRNRFGRKVARVLFMVIALLVFVVVAGSLVKILWNAILPDLFGWNTIGFYQAVGLLLLSRILFGKFGWHKKGGGWSNHRKERWRKKWSSMTEEDRQAFKARWKDRCK